MAHECSKQADRWTDRQTDRQDYYVNTALCTKVHRAVKTFISTNNMKFCIMAHSANCPYDSFQILKIFRTGEDGHFELCLSNKTANIFGKNGHFTTKCHGYKTANITS